MDSQRGGDGLGSLVQSESKHAIVSRLAEQDKIPWYSKPNLRRLYFLMLPTCLAAEMMSGFGSSVINGLQAVPSWIEYYDHPRSSSLGLMTAMDSLGSLAALPFVPSIVDKLGRRDSIFLGAVISIAGGILQGSAMSFLMFVVARFVFGFAKVICIVAASSLIGELSHPKERAIMGGLFDTSWDLGAITAAAVTLWTFAMTSNWGWRIPSFLQVVPGLLQISFIWFLPESPRWLISRGRGNEAYAIIMKYHAEGDEDSEFAKAEYTQIKETLEAELKTAQTNQKEVLSTPGMRRRVIIAVSLGLFASWSGVDLIVYLLSPILDSIGIHDNRTKNIVNLAKTSWGLVNGTFMALIVPRYPRRRMFLACTISLFVVFTAWTIASAEYSFSRSKISAQVVLALIFLYSPAYNMGFNVLTYTYLVELFPFHVRARGITLYQWCYRGAGFLGQFANPIGMDLAGWKWYMVYCVWNAFQVVFVYLMFPETSGRTLEELSFLYECDERLELLGNSELEALLENREGDARDAIQDS
ncbi:general substrate transporter [Boletus edulis]|nr:general substrate transporter [Boletus edulis]